MTTKAQALEALDTIQAFVVGGFPDREVTDAQDHLRDFVWHAPDPAKVSTEDELFKSAYGVERAQGHPIAVEAWNRRSALASDFGSALPSMAVDAARDMYSGD